MPDLARLRAKRLFLLDLDGTLYLDERLFVHADAPCRKLCCENLRSTQ